MSSDYKKLSAKKRRELLDAALMIHGWTCCICATSITPGDESLQHIQPRSKGGTNDLANLRPAHKRCNFALGNRELDEALIVAGGEAFFCE